MLRDGRHQRKEPYDSCNHGKIERQNRIMVVESLHAQVWTSNHHRITALSAWNIQYNDRRPHTAAGDRPPTARFNTDVTDVVAAQPEWITGTLASGTGRRLQGGTAVTNYATSDDDARVGDVDEHGLPLFHGAVEVLRLIRVLYRRRRTGRRRAEAARDWLPMLCFVRGPQHHGLLSGLADRFKHAEPHRIPHAFLSLEPAVDVEHSLPGADVDAPARPRTREDVVAVREILRRIAEELADTRNRHARRLRFPRLGLALWLMRQDLSQRDSSEREAMLRRRLRRSKPQALGTLREVVDDASAPSWWWYVTSSLNLLGTAWSWLTLSGRVPWPGRIYWWFVHQRYIAAEEPGSFIGFAERLTLGEWEKESPEHVIKLLTDALLEDLRQEYAGPPWYRGRRRTAHAIVLLDDITRDNGGYTLLKTVNDVRNDSGRPDPLLIITASRKVPPHAIEPTTGDIRDAVYDATQAEIGYEGWLRKLTDERRKRKEMAFYLPISLSSVWDEDQGRTLRRALAADGGYVLDRPPWWSRRILWVGACALLIAAGAAAYVQASFSQCGSGWSPPSLHPTVWTTDSGECVGVSDGSHHFFSGSGSPEESVLKQNRDAERAYEQGNGAPTGGNHRNMITLAYVGALNDSDAQDSRPSAEVETLLGATAAQDKENNVRKNGPLVRLLIVNAGHDMSEGDHVAGELNDIMDNHSELADADAPLVGAVGFDQSSKPTRKTVEALTTAGLPMVAGPLSADDLAWKFPLYYTVAPTNRREAQVADAFARNLAQGAIPGAPNVGKKVQVYYSDDANDTYSSTLDRDIKEEMPDFSPTDENMPGGAEKAAGEGACDHQGELVFYAGRETGFDRFLDGVKKCGNNPPVILADDDVSRLVADPARRDNTSIPFYVESFAVAPTTSQPDQDQNLTPFEQRLYDNMMQASHRPTVDGHAALAYDAIDTMFQAAQNADSRCYPDKPSCDSISPSTVSSELAALPGWAGATGFIDFDHGRAHSPVSKPVSVLHINGEKVDLIAKCGYPPAGHPLTHCPTD